MKRWIRQEEVQENIDISPLIDMVFILLIFFMVSTTFVKDMQVNIERPSASTAEMSSTKSIRVFMDSRKKVFLNGAEVPMWSLQGRIKDMIKNEDSKDVLVVTDGGVSAQDLIQLVDQCRLAGANQVGVATDKDQS